MRSAVQGIEADQVKAIVLVGLREVDLPVKSHIGVAKRDGTYITDQRTIRDLLNCFSHATYGYSPKKGEPFTPSEPLRVRLLLKNETKRNPEQKEIEFWGDETNQFSQILSRIRR